MSYSGTSVLTINLFWNSWWLPNNEASSFAGWHHDSHKFGESQASAECWHVFFLVKKQWVQGLMSSEANEYWGMTVFLMCSHVCGVNCICDHLNHSMNIIWYLQTKWGKIKVTMSSLFLVKCFKVAPNGHLNWAGPEQVWINNYRVSMEKSSHS